MSSIFPGIRNRPRCVSTDSKRLTVPRSQYGLDGESYNNIIEGESVVGDD
jgi:hypothetical protein